MVTNLDVDMMISMIAIGIIKARILHRGFRQDEWEGDKGGEEEGGGEGESSRVRGGGFPQPAAIDRKFRM